MKRIFLSYAQASDEPHRRVLEQFAKDKGIEFVSATDVIAPGSDWRKSLEQSLEDTDLVMVLIGERTHQSKWVEHEVSAAAAMGKPVVALKTARNNVTPGYLYGKGVTWSGELTADAFEKIVSTSDRADEQGQLDG